MNLVVSSLIGVSIRQIFFLIFVVYRVSVARISIAGFVSLESNMVRTIVVMAVGVPRLDSGLFYFGLELETGGGAMGICLGEFQGTAIFARCPRG